MDKSLFQAFAFTALAAVMLSVSVNAAPLWPHQFYGDVLYNGNPAPDGLLVVARIDGVDVAGTSTLGGTYGLKPADIFYIRDPYGDRNGKTVEFFVKGIKAGQHIFLNGNSTELDLSITESTPPPNNPPPSGGPVGSVPPVIVTTPVNDSDQQPSECSEDWMCTDWLDCVNGKQRRICADQNVCGTELGRPAEEQECEMVSPCVEDWTCEPWSACQADGTQSRTCSDVNACGTEDSKPALNQECSYSPFTGMFATPAGIVAIVAFVLIVVAGFVYVKFLR